MINSRISEPEGVDVAWSTRELAELAGTTVNTVRPMDGVDPGIHRAGADVAYDPAGRAAQSAVPPDASMTWPVTQRPSSEARKAMMLTTSSGWPSRPRATRAVCCAASSGLSTR